MSDFLFETDEHRAIREQARRFAEREIRPQAEHWEEHEEFPVELYRSLAEAGILGLGYPEEFGGTGGDFTHALVASEELLVA
ncbi:MAG: acyl-CoA dehydrogenase family protein, partial [Myxococcota bacterium]